MVIKSIEYEKPTNCPKCKKDRMESFEGKSGKKGVTIVKLYGNINPGVNNATSRKDNAIGWICRNCGEYKLLFEVLNRSLL